MLIPSQVLTQQLTIGQEAAEKHITLKEDPPDAVNAMLRFFYRGDYEFQTAKGAQAAARNHHVDVYVIADKYGVLDLASLAAQRFTNNISLQDAHRLEDVVKDLWSNEGNVDKLKCAALEAIFRHSEATTPEFERAMGKFMSVNVKVDTVLSAALEAIAKSATGSMSAFTRIVEHLWTDQSQLRGVELRATALAVLVARSNELQDPIHAKLKACIAQTPALATELFFALANRKLYTCGCDNCNRSFYVRDPIKLRMIFGVCPDCKHTKRGVFSLQEFQPKTI